jgi:deoxyribonuclease-1
MSGNNQSLKNIGPKKIWKFIQGGIVLLALIYFYADQSELVGQKNVPDNEFVKVQDYETARRLLWSKVYSDGGETLYCGERFGPRKGREINVEHVLPMSWATRFLKCGSRNECRKSSSRFNQIEGDLHNLYPSLASINKARSSFPYGEISGERRNYGKCDFELDARGKLVEPRARARGEIARAMFYMKAEYGIAIRPRLGKLLYKWHRQDPPDKIEEHRNVIIEKLQGNRNAFIDNPELADDLKF